LRGIEEKTGESKGLFQGQHWGEEAESPYDVQGVKQTPFYRPKAGCCRQRDLGDGT